MSNRFAPTWQPFLRWPALRCGFTAIIAWLVLLRFPAIGMTQDLAAPRPVTNPANAPPPPPGAQSPKPPVPDAEALPRPLPARADRLPRYNPAELGWNDRNLSADVPMWNQELQNVLKSPGKDSGFSADVLRTKIGLAILHLGQVSEAQTILDGVEVGCRKRLSAQSGSPEFRRDLGVALANLAVLDQRRGDAAQALARLTEACSLLESAPAMDPTRLALTNDLANQQYELGNLNDAEQVYSRILGSLESLPGTEASRADALHNLAIVAWRSGELDEADRLIRSASDLAFAKASRIPEAVRAHFLETRGLICSTRGKVEDSNRAFTEALAIYETVRPRPVDSIARVRNNWGLNKAREGKLDEAESLISSALELRQKLFGESHLSYADSLQDSARVADAAGKAEQAVSRMSASLAIVQQQMSIAARCQSERQQLEMAATFRDQLDLLLSFSSRANSSASQTYPLVLASKGAVFARQNCQRIARQFPELQSTFQQLDLVSRRLAALSFASPPSKPEELAAWQARIQTLLRQKEELEQRLAPRRGPGGVSARTEITAESLQSVLPEATALVDYLEYEFSPPLMQQTSSEKRFVAFVTKAGSSPVRFDLGPSGELPADIDRWRNELLAGDASAASSSRIAARIWTPLEASLADCTTVLISPDGALNRLPFAALPGRKSGTFLLEETALVVIPTPQHLPTLLSNPDPVVPPAEAPDNLLAVGDVEFAATQESKSPTASIRRRRAGTHLEWQELPATRGEVLAISNSFRSANPQAAVTLLDRADATEETVRGSISSHRYLHFATHGFFAPPEIQSALAVSRGSRHVGLAEKRLAIGSGIHPGLLSGLVFAGANQPPVDGDDGVLTALEVAELNLSQVELAVLSACETGLGEVAGGEGTLGLQRAFHVAGARSVVASLWKVDDEQTRQLMERFYENYWRKQLSMVESLREAQLWMMRNDSRRDLRVKPINATPATEKRLPPYYWSAFFLSGDWR